MSEPWTVVEEVVERTGLDVVLVFGEPVEVQGELVVPITTGTGEPPVGYLAVGQGELVFRPRSERRQR